MRRYTRWSTSWKENISPNEKSIIPYGKQSITAEDIQAVCEVLGSDWITQALW